MDPDLDTFVRLKPQSMQLQQAVELEDACTCLALSSDAQLLAAGSCEPAVMVYDLALALKYSLAGHAGGTNSLAFAKGGRLLSAGEDGDAAVWDCTNGSCIARLECEGEHVDRTPDGHTVNNAACNRSGTLAAVAAGRTLHLFAMDDDDFEASRRTFPAVSGGVIEAVKFLGDNKVLVAYYGGVSIFSTEEMAPGMMLEYGTNVLSVAATPGLSYVVGGCMDSCVHIWQFSTEEGADKTELVEYSCGGYMTKVGQVDFNSEGTALASIGGTQNTVWDFTGEGPAGSIPVVTLGHTKNCTCQAWQPVAGSKLLVTGGKDGRVLVYDTSLYAEPDEEGIPKFAAPISVAPDPEPDEITALVRHALSPGHCRDTL
eukprot:GHUV01019041.1.p1 GENE.GHUV01019041.1~~GHUV01019041.1.p1  ORF type:complete len:372 (+),score=94.31 GHUV01019041.1:697-1812(+)